METLYVPELHVENELDQIEKDWAAIAAKDPEGSKRVRDLFFWSPQTIAALQGGVQGRVNRLTTEEFIKKAA